MTISNESDNNTEARPPEDASAESASSHNPSNLQGVDESHEESQQKQTLPDDIDGGDDDDDVRRQQRQTEELLEQMMLEQEVADQHVHQQMQVQQQQQLEEAEAVAAGLQNRRFEEEAEREPLLLAGGGVGAAGAGAAPAAIPRKHIFSYTQTSFLAAIILIVHALRTREQWYLALVYLSSSKWAYVILGNALIAFCVSVFRTFTHVFLNGLRLVEAEGLQDFFRWEVTETCLALTMFRSELHVSTGVLFLLLVLMKCLHYVAEQRESHLRMTQDAIVVVERAGSLLNQWPRLPSPHAKLAVMLIVLQCLDILAVVECGQTIARHGPSVALFFGFEAAILLVSAISMLLLWQLHVLDGFLHYLHDNFTHPLCRRWLHPWKEIRATLVFAVEVQAQAAKFLFYVTFFAIVLTYYGLPINLFREVYLSFMVLKQRLVAFGKYRQLMASMDRFANPTTEDLVAADTCIICRDSMLMADGKKLPCAHVFHKSCLREWLVQNQICPICRSDITLLEARQRHQRQQQQLAQQRELQIEQAPVAEIQQQQDGGREGTSSQSDALPGAPGEGRSETTRKERSPSVSFAGVSTPDSDEESGTTAAFPAIYKVVCDDGALVWEHSENSSSSVVVRTVANSMLVLCQGMQWRSVINPNDGFFSSGMMLRIPDGWVHEKHLERLLHIQLPKKVEPALPRLTVESAEVTS